MEKKAMNRPASKGKGRNAAAARTAEGVCAEEMPLFSVIVLAYQQQDVIDRCIESVLEQTYSNIELVICDDGSLDFDEKAIRRLIGKRTEKLHRLVLYHSPQNVGPVRNAQKGLELSEGVYCKFLAADDWFIDSNVLECIAEQFKNPNTDVVAARSRGATDEGETLDHYYPASPILDYFADADANEQFALLATQPPQTIIWEPAVFMRRSVLDEIGGFDCSYHHDRELPTWFRLLEKGHRFTITNTVMTVSRYGGPYNRGIETSCTELANEQIRAIEEIAMPRFEQQGEKSRSMRCRHNMWRIRASLVHLFEWSYMSTGQKLFWRLKNSKELLIAKLYSVYSNGLRINHRPLLYAMAASFLLYVFHMEFIPGHSLDKLWAICFTVALGVMAVQFCVVYGIGLLTAVFKWIRGRK